MTRDSAAGRSVATFIQALLAFLVGLYAVPGVKDYVTSKPKVAAIMAALVAIATLINNVFRKEVPNI